MKKYRYYCALDNGVSGTGCVLDIEMWESWFWKTPVIKCLSYTKKPQHIQRIAWGKLIELLPKSDAFVMLERPLVNPRMFSATQSALRALESTIICLEYLGLDYDYTDSKSWQSKYLSSGIIGHDQMKAASMHVAIELYPQHEELIRKHGDGDALLIARYAQEHFCK
jgi:hypothetical protein